MRCLLIVLSTIISFPSLERIAFAAEPDFPASLLGFIGPGMKIGIRSSQSDSLTSIEIYDEAQFRFAKDARMLTLEELGKKYPEVSDKAAKALADYQSSIVGKDLDRKRGFEPYVAIDVDPTTTLCTVLYVADDYFLVTYGSDNSRRQAIAKQAVTRIRWATDDLRFKTSHRVVRRTE